MADHEVEIFTKLYALRDAIQVKDFPTAIVLWDQLLNLHAPLAEDFPLMGRVLRQEDTMIKLAERQSTKIH